MPTEPQERRRGERVPRRCRYCRLLDDEGVGRAGARCEALLTASAGSGCGSVLLDDLRADPLGTYRGTLAFLSLKDDGREALPRRYESRAVRSVPLHLLVSQPRSEVVRVRAGPAAPVAPLPAGRGAAEGSLRRANREASAPARLTPELRETLSRAFAEDVLILSRVLERDLSHWLAAKPQVQMPRPLS